MHLASLLLSRQQLSVSEVARRLGYESEPSFSRAFKRLHGVPPNAKVENIESLVKTVREFK